MNFFQKTILLLACIFAFAKCTPPIDNPTPTTHIEFRYGVYVLCEGVYGAGSSSVSWYNLTKSEVTNDIFHHLNNDENLGDVAQSMRVIGDKLYIVVNNDGKIVKVDPVTFKKLGEIKGFDSPRYIIPINSTQAYVSNLVLSNGTTAIQKVDLTTNQIIARIPMQFAEQMQQVPADNNAVWTGITNTNWLLRINTTTDNVTDTVRLSDSPKYIFLDKNNVSLWVVCEGNYNNGTPSICRINTLTKQIEQRFDLPQGANTIAAVSYSAKFDCFYYVYDS